MPPASSQPRAERVAPEEQLGAIIRSFYGRSQSVREATVIAFNPPPIPGLCSTGGFSFKLQDRAGNTPEDLARVAQEFVNAALQRPEIGNAFSKFDPRTPAIRLDIDREKAKKLGVSISDVSLALQTFLGGLDVNDFSRFGEPRGAARGAPPPLTGSACAA